ncbi:UNVERIFIED_CONTAM: LacI family DNA-binding transcriptional regulator [Kocuria sp. CPCC 205295]|uniref:LacI family DNA-binding transcriptional regulator n=1 Tax=Kocuria sp. CPCC 205295 TaxID=3073557 RepID=UPI0036DAAC01
MNRRRPTLKDVAAQAGLSVIVASNTFSRPDRVSESSRERIMRAAQDIGYRPNRAAQALRTGKSGLLGIVVSEHLGYAFRDPSAARFLTGVADVCAERGVGMALLPTGDRLSGEQAVESAAVDGFVFWTTTPDDPALAAAIDTGTPVAVQGGPHMPGAVTVSIDDEAAAAALTTRMLQHGPRIAVIAFPTHRGGRPRRTSLADVDAELPVTAARLTGIAHAITQAGGDPLDVACHVLAVNDRHHAAQLVSSWGSVEDLDAIICLSDEIALGAHDALRTFPHQPALAGFDGAPEALEAGIVSISQDLQAQGSECARIVFDNPAQPPPRSPWSIAP